MHTAFIPAKGTGDKGIGLQTFIHLNVTRRLGIHRPYLDSAMCVHSAAVN
jgi:hypothetical protein